MQACGIRVPTEKGLAKSCHHHQKDVFILLLPFLCKYETSGTPYEVVTLVLLQCCEKAATVPGHKGMHRS